MYYPLCYLRAYYNYNGNWQLAPLLIDFGFDSTVRSFRKGYALEFLIIFYNKSRLVHLDIKHSDVRITFEKKLCRNIITTLQEISTGSPNDP